MRRSLIPSNLLPRLLALGAYGLLAAACGGQQAVPEATDAAPLAQSGAGEPVATAGSPGKVTADKPGAKSPALIPSDPDEAVKAAMANMLAAKSYRVTQETAGITMEVEVVLPDKMHVKTGALGEMVIVGKDTYLNVMGQWSKQTNDESLAQMLSQVAPAVDSLVIDAKAQGTETIDGVETHVYSYTSEQSMAGQAVKATVKLWVADDTGLPIRQEIQGEAMGQTTVMVQDIEYVPDLEIEVPAEALQAP